MNSKVLFHIRTSLELFFKADAEYGEKVHQGLAKAGAKNVQPAANAPVNIDKT